jgi:hypothetical protein
MLTSKMDTVVHPLLSSIPDALWGLAVEYDSLARIARRRMLVQGRLSCLGLSSCHPAHCSDALLLHLESTFAASNPSGLSCLSTASHVNARDSSAMIVAF